MRRLVAAWVCMFVVAITCGCKPKASAPENVTEATVAKGPVEKCEIELSEPKLVFVPPELLKFEVKYKFTKGSPNKSYMCVLNFPGTKNQGQKPMEAWEMKMNGTIKGGIELQSLDPPVKEFEITVGEAEVPQSGYETISNKITGEVEYPDKK